MGLSSNRRHSSTMVTAEVVEHRTTERKNPGLNPTLSFTSLPTPRKVHPIFHADLSLFSQFCTFSDIATNYKPRKVAFYYTFSVVNTPLDKSTYPK